MSDDAVMTGLVEAVFDVFPALLSGDKQATLESLQAFGFRPARGPNGQAMMARQLNQMGLYLAPSPPLPLPRINLVGPNAASYLDSLESVLQARGFQQAKATTDEKRELRTYSATTEGPIMTVTMARPVGTDTLLSVVVVPPIGVGSSSQS